MGWLQLQKKEHYSIQYNMFSIQEYKESLLYDDSFKTLKIKPVTDEQGEFIFSSGRTAVVFKVQDLTDGGYKGLKCFTLIHENALERNQTISRFLQFVQSPYLVPYRFLEEEIWVDDGFKPVVLMDWVEGNTLHQTLGRLCTQRKNKEILNLALQFDQMALWWLGQNFAHGDLKADNLIITPLNHLVAVDYEGFFVPSLQGQQAMELGTEDYQHPDRKAGFFCPEMDHVSMLIISAALHALAHESDLWETYNRGENVLFTKQDLELPGKTDLWTRLLKMDSNPIRNRLNLLLYALTSSPREVHGIKQVLQMQGEDIAHLERIQSPKYRPGTLDTTFMESEKQIPILNGIVNCIDVLPNGKILAGGSFSGGIALFDGELNRDMEFQKLLKGGFNKDVYSFQPQPDGKTIVGGEFTEYNGKPSKHIARILPDGRLDESFNIGKGFDKVVRVIQLQPDGKIIVGGDFTEYNGKPSKHIARILPDGRLDENFYIQKGFDDLTWAIQMQPDGKIIVGGAFTSYNGRTCENIVRLLYDGTVDEDFKTGKGFNDLISAIQLQPDGKIIVGGCFTEYDGKPSKNIARVLPDGRLDDNFNIGEGFEPSVFGVSSLFLQLDAKILACGDFKSYNGKPCNFIARIMPDGTLDESFNKTEFGFDNEVNTLQIQSDGRILAGGKFKLYNGEPCNSIALLKQDGELCKSFIPQSGFDGLVNTIQLQADGKILTGGNFKSYNGKRSNLFSRILSDGKLDESFNTGVGFDSLNFLNTIKLQADGKLLVCGRVRSSNGKYDRVIVRLMPNKKVDNSFKIVKSGNWFSLFFLWVNKILIQLNGKILVGGSFSSYNGKPCGNIVRLLYDGTIDEDFKTGKGFNNVVRSLDIQSDGKILVCGSFSTYDGKPCNQIARLHPNGALDDDFNTNNLFNEEVKGIQLQPDGKILVYGNFTSHNGKTINRLARLLSDGILDESFKTGIGFDNEVYTLQIQSDGKILAGGEFSFYNRNQATRLARLLPNGQLDSDFDIGQGFDSSVYALALTHDNKLLVGGNFTTYGDQVYNSIVRIHL
jgi:uncharacterized delta-60 repeat protein